MSDPDRPRPALPDPQQDRHVAFPDDAGPRGPLASGASLPPEAWAPRTPGNQSATTSGATGGAPTRGLPVPAILTTPPGRPEPRRRSRGWAALLLVPALLMGVSNHGSSESSSTTQDCTHYADAGPGTADCGSSDGPADGSGNGWPADPVVGVWAEDVTASTRPLAPVQNGSPKVVPVPADTTALRVEIVSSAGPSGSRLETQVDTTVGGSMIDAWDQGLPHAVEIHLENRPTDLAISVAINAGSGTVQCRVYAGSTLVAFDTSITTATCRPEL
ncbi:hypothetical protein GCM10009868_11910 [Terrabacter aerolatus]|uniref:Uncharacterized protein n=1 Tax=Terrabacter aerolatus TaxID=422442 RepID=A0A512CXY1_9MICO|nr:hypothetical protein [Terrabacter aerolatus]GEO29047.1 hypothetical protein TAE01_08570 [Terrabacter aerolatus]